MKVLVLTLITVPVMQRGCTNSQPHKDPNHIHHNIRECAAKTKTLVKTTIKYHHSAYFLWSPDAKHKLISETAV